jgi:UDP-3-O-acyl N-acetylglucosamine deacetylase
MHAARNQHTIAGPATVAGFGYWSGRDVGLEFRPAPPDFGIVFVRTDLEGCPRIPAAVAHRVETPRRTSLRTASASVDMVEHVLAALSGLAIDNCEVWVDQAEMPGMDGSALPFVEALDRAGRVEQAAPRVQRVIREPIRVGDDEAWIEAGPAGAAGPLFRYRLDYGPQNPIGRQVCEIRPDPGRFRHDLAPSRTFMLKAEAEWLLAQGIGTRATAKDLVVFGADGPIDNALRFDNECARHKLLDLIGDLALAQCELIGQVYAYRSGHRLNAELVRALLLEAEPVRVWRRSA